MVPRPEGDGSYCAQGGWRLKPFSLSPRPFLPSFQLSVSCVGAQNLRYAFGKRVDVEHVIGSLGFFPELIYEVNGHMRKFPNSVATALIVMTSNNHD